MFNHRLDFHRAHDEVIEGNRLVRRSVAVNQRVKDVIIQMITRGRQRFAQLISIQLVGVLAIVKLEDGLGKKENGFELK